jgi:hypothetical protein
LPAYVVRSWNVPPAAGRSSDGEPLITPAGVTFAATGPATRVVFAASYSSKVTTPVPARFASGEMIPVPGERPRSRSITVPLSGNVVSPVPEVAPRYVVVVPSRVIVNPPAITSWPEPMVVARPMS